MTFVKIDLENDGNEHPDKVILIHGFSDKQLNLFIEYYKSNPDLPKTNFAVVTSHSKLRRVRDVINEIAQEGRMLKRHQ
ncbi:MAG: DUF3783 domain-containing protein [Nanoarchaeota archaeon]